MTLTRAMLLSLLVLVLLSLTQASVLLSPEQNSVSASDKKDTWEQLDAFGYVDDGSDVIVDETADEIDADNKLDEELTEEEKETGSHVEFPVEKMDDDEVKLYLNLEDQIFLSEADEHVAFKLLEEKRSLSSKGGDGLRRKRIAPLIGRVAFAVARSMFRRFARSHITRRGSRLTRHYSGQGSYRDAVRDFNRLRPQNARSFSGRISGQTGTVGRHRVTVRDGSSGNSRPTMEVRSHEGNVVRKFRYND